MNSHWLMQNVLTESNFPDEQSLDTSECFKGEQIPGWTVIGYFRMFQRRANSPMNSHWLLQNVSKESKFPDEQSLATSECFNGEQIPGWTVIGYFRMFQRRANSRMNSHWLLQNVLTESKFPDEQSLATSECYNGEQTPGWTVIGYYWILQNV